MGTLRRFVKRPHQHHVWQEYLRSWADAGGAVFCLQKRFINDVLMPTQLERQFPDAPRDPEYDELLDAYYTNVVDDHHTILENSFLPFLTQSLREDLSCYENGVNRIAFYVYIVAQHLRTRRAKDRIIARLRRNMGLDFSRIWNVLAVVFAFNTSSNMFGDSGLSLTLVRNQTSVPFVTGDQPVINLDADGETAPKLLSFYYPLSPQLALYLSEPGSTLVPAFIDSAEKAMELNLRIARTSHRQTYAATREILDDLRERLESVDLATH